MNFPIEKFSFIQSEVKHSIVKLITNVVISYATINSVITKDIQCVVAEIVLSRLRGIKYLSAQIITAIDMHMRQRVHVCACVGVNGHAHTGSK